MTLPRAVLSWSSGKDCAYALHLVRQQGLAEVVALLSTTDEALDRVSMHGTRTTLLRAQAAAIGLPLIEVPLPSPCPSDLYAARMTEAMAQVTALGAVQVIFGDILLEDLRAWREARLAPLGITATFPLWGRDTAELARTIIAEGFQARIVCLDPTRLPEHLAGRAFDESLLADLPPGIDPCGENGEFHTAVTGGPIFAHALAVTPGPVTTRAGFVHADLIPA